jgi:hypothetical protein
MSPARRAAGGEAVLPAVRQPSSGRNKVCVMVLGELGCSPRMLYHGASLARMGHEVHFVGFAGVRCF